mmetsp:Transcript_53243/g.108313  ORF Transcript_53243/g.108313 Transcript_53243/m.108313 type:complete len:105 (-) Transcript_53243:266-580(-)
MLQWSAPCITDSQKRAADCVYEGGTWTLCAWSELVPLPAPHHDMQHYACAASFAFSSLPMPYTTLTSCVDQISITSKPRAAAAAVAACSDASDSGSVTKGGFVE